MEAWAGRNKRNVRRHTHWAYKHKRGRTLGNCFVRRFQNTDADLHNYIQYKKNKWIRMTNRKTKNPPTHGHKHTLARAHTHTHTSAHACTYTHTHTHKHIHSLTHTHTLSPPPHTHSLLSCLLQLVQLDYLILTLPVCLFVCLSVPRSAVCSKTKSPIFKIKIRVDG